MKKLCLILLTILFAAFLYACKSENSQILISGNTNLSESNAEIDNITVPSEKNTEKKEIDSIIMEVGNKSFTARLYNNKTAQAFAKMLPLTINMSELNGNEKYCYMNSTLPSDSSGIGIINSGDIMLYGDDCLVLFYNSFSTSYSYTKIGQIDNPQDLEKALGNGDIKIKFYTEE